MDDEEELGSLDFGNWDVGTGGEGSMGCDGGAG